MSELRVLGEDRHQLMSPVQVMSRVQMNPGQINDGRLSGIRAQDKRAEMFYSAPQI